MFLIEEFRHIPAEIWYYTAAGKLDDYNVCKVNGIIEDPDCSAG